MFALVPRMLDLQLGLMGFDLVLRRLARESDDPQCHGIDTVVARYGG